MRTRLAALAAFSIVSLLALACAAAAPTAAQLEFFETSIRPVLVEQCYSCHNSAKKAEGGFALDDRASLLKGGDGGAVIVPGKPGESRLLPILRHEVEDLEMPQDSGKLDERTIANFEKWIAMGAPDPRDRPPTTEELTQATAWEAVLAKRKKWWSFQPIREVAPPVVPDNTWSDHPVDRFLLAKLREQKLESARPADANTLVRRLYFNLLGMPPTAEETQLWTARLQQSGGYEALVDHLLASPHFGEHWARHWMDWTRYAESHGSEGDPTIEGAWHYRDYLIRALNADVPYDQLVREHVAGDLLEQPRINQQLGINESAIGPAHWRMVFHGFAPTDALDEKVRFVDDQINTFSKAFLGLTVSCARCHDHKFDAISQRDYYALFGVLGSCRPGRSAIDTDEKLSLHRGELAALKPKIRNVLAEAWLKNAGSMRAQILAAEGPAFSNAEHPVLQSFHQVRKQTKDGMPFNDAWQRVLAGWKDEQAQREAHASRNVWQRWKLSDEKTYAAWFKQGTGLLAKPFEAGEFAIAASSDQAITGIYPAGVYSHALSAKHAARLSSADVRLDGNYDLYLNTIGDGTASARYVVRDYPRNGTVYPVNAIPKDWQWMRFDMSYWNADQVHVELSAAQDAPLLAKNDARSWFGIREAIIVPKGEPAPPSAAREFNDALLSHAIADPPDNLDELAGLYAEAITAAIRSWQKNSANDAQALLLDACVMHGLLPNKLDQLDAAKTLIAEYRRLEEPIVVPTRVPGLQEAVAHDQPLLVRGDHKQPGDVVPRRFLEAIDATPYKTSQSGRRQLAEDLLRDDNPLTKRVIVNRIWHHLLGRGIVGTPDNFGRLGQEPTHPELLDYLATRFQKDRWSMKQAIRLVVTSKAWQVSAQPSARSLEVDADNRWLSHTFVRRLEAESIRDSLLAVAGTLDRQLYGTPTDGNSARRSVYVRVQRNALDPFLRTFDFPEPFSTTGRRDATNVPAQSLAMMNDPRVATLAGNWAAGVLANKELSSEQQRIERMFLMALGRSPSAGEVQRFERYLQETKRSHEEIAKQLADLRRQATEQQAVIERLMEPVRARLLKEAKASTISNNTRRKPIAQWEFQDDLQDTIGAAHGSAQRGAKLENGALVLRDQAYAVTAPIKAAIKEKTLESWVQLSDLDQRGGGVMSIQTPDGAFFDAIVFAEQSPRQWLAGSNHFARTSPFDGPQEKEALDRAVHLAFAYHADGRIVAYRDGKPYGKPLKTNGPLEFTAGQAVIAFGVRHLPAGGNRMLAGKILRASLYDRALSAEEVEASSQAAPYFVPESSILAKLKEREREQITKSRATIARLDAGIAALGTPAAVNEQGLWTSVAHAIFTFQEFIYIK